MFKYRKIRNTSTIQALCKIDASGNVAEQVALIGTERELLDHDMIVPFKKHFNASDIDPNNYLIVYPSGKVMSCGTLLNAKNTLGKEYPTR